MILVKLCDTKTKIDRLFVVRDELLDVVRKYEALRPVNTKTDRFFLNYKNGKCTRQPIGRHTIALMPKQIALFLQLPEAELYTGHCFRRSSATLLADSGANLTALKRLGGWRSDKVAESYIEESIENKSDISTKINRNIKMISSTPQQEPLSLQSSTSRQPMKQTSPQSLTSRFKPPSPMPTTTEQYIGKTAQTNTDNQILNSQTTDVKQTTINVPGKTISFSFTNCPNMSNITFNIN